MARPAISKRKITDTLSLSECHDGYWIYDYVIGMNLSMRAKTEIDALEEALIYYQKSLKKCKERFEKLDKLVNNFIESLDENEEK